MIHDVPNQLKFKRFVRLIGPLCGESVVTAETIAVAILERLWHTAIDNAQAGDIGKLSDDDIAEALGWLGDASSLVAALVDSRWIDRCDVHRLVIHDWAEHCPNFIKGNFAKHNRVFAIATCLSNLPKHAANHDEHGALAPTPNLTKPNQTKPDLTEPDLTSPPASAVSQEFSGERRKEVLAAAQTLKDRIQPVGFLSARNRQLVLKLVCMSLSDAEVGLIIGRQVTATLEKLDSPKPPNHPWGYLKSKIIAAVKAAKKDFDVLWDSVLIPEELAKSKA